MFLEPRPDGARPVSIPWNPVGMYVLMITVPIIVLGLWIQPLSVAAENIAWELIR